MNQPSFRDENPYESPVMAELVKPVRVRRHYPIFVYLILAFFAVCVVFAGGLFILGMLAYFLDGLSI